MTIPFDPLAAPYLDDGLSLEAPSNSITFYAETGRPIAVLKAGGLVCEQNSYPNLTSREFATKLKKTLKENGLSHSTDDKNTLYTLSGCAVLKATKDSIELLVDGDEMSLFDQHVFSHLQELWRK
jgi:hypothetical protein